MVSETWYKVVVSTILPRSGLTVGQETERQSYNKAIIGNTAEADLGRVDKLVHPQAD
jgi:hypothetical protein